MVFGAAGAYGVFRTFYRPARAVVADGFVTACAAANGKCDPAMVIESLAGRAPVYATTSGRVIALGQSIQIASSTEPIVQRYDFDPTKGFEAQVANGQKVGIGQQIALAERVAFSVFVAWRNNDGSIKWIPNEPASWLAARGLSISVKKRSKGEGGLWCDGGRKISVPGYVPNCNIRLPTPGSFMLLPVSVTTE